MHMQVALLIHLIHFHINVFQEFQERGSRARAKSVIPILIILVAIRHNLLVSHIK